MEVLAARLTEYNKRSARPERRGLTVFVTLFLVAIGSVSLFFCDMPLPRITSFMPVCGTMAMMSNLLAACLLLSSTSSLKDRSKLCLGIAFFFSALIAVPQTLAFPGTIFRESVTGQGASAVWLWCFWHAGFSAFVIASRLQQPATLYDGDLLKASLATLGLVIALTLVATAGLSILPNVLLNGGHYRLNNFAIGPVVLGASIAATFCTIGINRVDDTRSLPLTISTLANAMDVAITLVAGARFSLGWYVGHALDALAGVAVSGALLAKLIRQASHVEYVNRRLEDLLHIDVLTEIRNRRSFASSLEMEWPRSHREQTPLSLLLVDIDFFKQYNDCYGHPAGDACLRLVAKIIAAQVKRPADVVARFGGEEFAILLPTTKDQGALHIARRIVSSVSSSKIIHERVPLGHVTVSIGVHTHYPSRLHEEPQGLIDAADEALYRAKSLGRNTVSQSSKRREAIESPAVSDDIQLS